MARMFSWLPMLFERWAYGGIFLMAANLGVAAGAWIAFVLFYMILPNFFAFFDSKEWFMWSAWLWVPLGAYEGGLKLHRDRRGLAQFFDPAMRD